MRTFPAQNERAPCLSFMVAFVSRCSPERHLPLCLCMYINAKHVSSENIRGALLLMAAKLNRAPADDAPAAF